MKKSSLTQKPTHNVSQLYLARKSLDCSEEEREEFATQTLLGMADTPQKDRHYGKLRESNNTSEITCWNQNYLNILGKKEFNLNRKKYHKFRMRTRKPISKENSFLENQTFNFHLDQSIKKETDKFKGPLREKILNSEQFRSLEVDKEKTKTKNEILLQIINCKQEIVPMMNSTKKSKFEWKCFSVAKERDESRNYQRIKRKEFSSWQSQNEENTAQITKGKSLVVTKTTYSNDLMNLRGKSIKKLFAE